MLHLQPGMSEPIHSPLARFRTRYFLLNSRSIMQWNTGWIGVKVLPLGFAANIAEYNAVINDLIVGDVKSWRNLKRRYVNLPILLTISMLFVLQ
mmetsp:Transcript_8416/g.12733  ORF Transcript_8416/g.12733 Transcript_8416/m.12733 type:complete len:94 (+) Transcript_8416:164-445(+)